MRKQGEATRPLQIRITAQEHRFLRHLVVEMDTTVSEIFRAYIKYLMSGGTAIGFGFDDRGKEGE